MPRKNWLSSEEKKKLKDSLLALGYPKCQNDDCNNDVTEYNDRKNRWNYYCSPKCKGVHNSKKSREKAKQTFLKIYGVESQFHSQVVKDKIKQSNLERWGVENVFENEDIKDKIKKSNLERYGSENVFQSDIIKDKIKQSNLEKYGVEYPQSLHETKEKVKLTNIIKYGGISPTCSSVIRDKIKKTNLEKYGRTSYQQRHMSEQTIKDINDIGLLLKLNETLNTNEIGKHIGVTGLQISRLFKKYNLPLKQHYTSIGENSIFDFIKAHTNTEIIKRDRSLIGNELDIYLPDKNIAIEYNGCYWHSESMGKDKNFHLNKTTKCREKGVHLLHIFENDWLQKQETCKSIILNLLGKNNSVYARSLSLINIDKRQEIEFLNQNHIQGYAGSSICYGLVNEQNELLSLMSFSKSRYNKNYEYELLRFCNKNYTNVVGGASKLFKYFVSQNNPSSIISYCHRHLFTGNIYKTLGFSFTHFTKPSYWYTMDYCTLFNRVLFQKHKLKDKLLEFDENLTEVENMNNNGYDRIWDCGNSVWSWKKE